MHRKSLILLVIIPLLLSACGSATGTPVEKTTSPTTVILPTETVAIQPIDTPETSGNDVNAQTVLISECTVVSALPEPPVEYVELFSVNEHDWVTGPEDATVTLIEYGDFQ